MISLLIFLSIYYDFESLLEPNVKKEKVQKHFEAREDCTCGRTLCKCIGTCFCYFLHSILYEKVIFSNVPDDDDDNYNDKIVQFHKPCMFSVIVVSSMGELLWEHSEIVNPETHEEGKNASEVLFDILMEMEPQFQEYCKGDKPLRMTAQNERDFQNATECSFCHTPKHQVQKFEGKDNVFCRDHDHVIMLIIRFLQI